MVMAATLQLQQAPVDARPPHAAPVDLPPSTSAMAAATQAQVAAQAPHVTLNRYLMEDGRSAPRRLQGERPALNVMLPP